ncbi:MAG: helix-turn-helix transcriptional regulator, partial [Clostridiales bacterium]|nr:helix-turn-helix transcriptional regulator [Clostridiales bacterium]
MDTVKFGVFLKTLRKEKDLTQEQLAEMLHVTNRTVSRWETGANLPDIDILITLSDYYKIDMREL